MTSEQKGRYKSADDLRKVLSILENNKFTLDCGHHVTFNQVLGNSVIVKNGKELKIVCTECGY